MYGELKRIAASRLRLERADHTLSAAGLVHEAYLKLVQTDLKWENAGHFRAIAARAMRQILVNHSLAHRSEKRGGDWIKLTLTGVEPEIEAQADGAVDILILDEALKALGELDPRQADLGYLWKHRFRRKSIQKGSSLPLLANTRSMHD